MGKIYILKPSFSPNTASTNRLIGLLKAFSIRGIDVEVVFFISDPNRSEAPEMPHIHYNYYWKKLKVKNEKLQTLLYAFLYSKLFIKRLLPGDTVYLYGCNEMIADLVKIRGIRVFHERTEHPSVSKLKLLNVDKYLEGCSKLSGLFVISTGLKEYYSSIGVPEKNIEIVNMTVDPTRFENLSKQKTERYIAYCGKATNNKDGVDRLIKSFAQISKSHPDVKLYIIGTPPSRADESGNLELVEELGISDKVIFTGIVAAEKIPQILKNAAILALARPDNVQAQYGFPTKLGEYLMTGNPVVITSVGDIPLFLKDQESALVASPNNIDDFAEKLDWVLKHPHEAETIGRRGYEVAIRNFNANIEAEKIITKLTKNL